MVDDPNAPGSGDPGPGIGDDDVTRYAPAAGAGAAPDTGGSKATLVPGSLLSHTYRIDRLLARVGKIERYGAVLAAHRVRSEPAVPRRDAAEELDRVPRLGRASVNPRMTL